MGVSFWNRVGLSANDGFSFWCGNHHCLEWRINSRKCNCAFLKTQHQLISTWCQLLNFSCLFVPSHSFNYSCHSWYHVRQLLFFKKEVQIHMAFSFTRSNRTTFCHCLLLADDLNATLCCAMLNNLIRIPSNDVISRSYMLVGLALISCCCNLIICVNICLYFINCSFSTFRTQNDHK